MKNAHFDILKQPISLVVDDEPIILMYTADLLSKEGYAVVEARTADHAFQILENHSSFKLLFTDVQMPGELTGSSWLGQ